jgi:FkbM family methyltransferase
MFHVLRSLVERVSRGRVLRRRLPAEFGSRAIYVTPDAALSFWRHDLGQIDPTLLRMAYKLTKPGAVVWDIGANVGLFSFASAAIAGRDGMVFAFEPDPWLGDLLRRSASERPPEHAPVHVLSAAISDKAGIMRFNISGRGRCSNYVSDFELSSSQGARPSLPVIGLTLDWLAQYLPPPSVLKIDIEGMDHLAIAGARKLLCAAHPVVITEAESHKELIGSILAECGYRFLDSELQPVNKIQHNAVAVPVDSAEVR